MCLDFDLVLSSPFLRARQTAEIIANAFKLKKHLAFSDALTPDGDPKVLIQQLNELKPAPENILLVGHEPYLSQLVALLISGGDMAAVELKKGGLCKLETGSLRSGRCAALAWLLTPKQLKLMK
jgi:phosphohistidine phosphatase